MTTTTPGTAANGVTVLTASSNAKTVKTYQIDAEGHLETLQYGKEKFFRYKLEPATSIHSLATLLTQLSTSDNKIIIRGQQKVPMRGPARRTLDIYAEPPEGLSWAMLDFDAIPLPDGLSPASREAIEWLIEKLPEPFHDATYFYQFSSSTGIFRPDGTPLKRGLNVHLFFWFSQPITGQLLKAYLTDHCIKVGFLERGRDKADSPRITYGVDMALFNPVQPHYIAAPIIKPGVTRTLDEKDRQGLVEKAVHSVVLPVIDPSLVWTARSERHRVLREHQRACGWVKARSLAKAKGKGIAIGEYYRNPAPSAIATGSELVDVRVKMLVPPGNDSEGVWIATLYFVDEKSSGSWYVKSTNPTIAVKYGDGEEKSHLKEKSPAAFEYVRDKLGWFSEIATHDLSLTAEGFLPDIPSFATARNCLILAPTGSGKTTAFCRFAAVNRSKVIIYAAQTIALTRQMHADLRASGVPVVHYKDFNRYEMNPAVYVTTNKSLWRFLDAADRHELKYTLVIDEAHIAFDDFMKSDSGHRLIEDAIINSDRTLFMTGTMTDVQLKTLTETVSRTMRGLTVENFGIHQFQPVKTNPLWWADQANFWRDFVALLRHYQSLKNAGEEIPRTIIIAPTSKLEPFRILLDWFGLSDQAEVVSRTESDEEDIEEARVSTQPILISSPLFALGLNFNALPKVFWTYFGHLQVDESHIVQTLNRANRDANPCEVRLYAGHLDEEPYRIPNEDKEKRRIEKYFREEATLEGLLDSHFQIDRVTYHQLRKGEKATAKALYRLKTDDAFQNYVVVENWDEWLDVTDDDKDVAREALEEARQQYDEDILTFLDKYEGAPQGWLFDDLDKNYEDSKEFRNQERLVKEYDDNRIALSMALAKIDDVRVGRKISALRLQRLFGHKMVFLSSQYDPNKWRKWMEVAAEKTWELVPLILNLEKLRNGVIDGIQFGWGMRKKNLKAAILASADGTDDFVKWEKQVDRLEMLYADRAKAGDKAYDDIDKSTFVIAIKFLRTIGVSFGKSMGPKKRLRIDPKKPIVPDWNFAGMAHRLIVKASQFQKLPKIPDDRQSDPLKWIEEQSEMEYQTWFDGYVSNEVCRQCRFCEPHFLCKLGRTIQPDWRGYEAHTHKCDLFKKVPAEVKQRFDLPASE
jgi:hypothetical protein